MDFPNLWVPDDRLTPHPGYVYLLYRAAIKYARPGWPLRVSAFKLINDRDRVHLSKVWMHSWQEEREEETRNNCWIWWSSVTFLAGFMARLHVHVRRVALDFAAWTRAWGTSFCVGVCTVIWSLDRAAPHHLQRAKELASSVPELHNMLSVLLYS
jgi:hypothetical protein